MEIFRKLTILVLSCLCLCMTELLYAQNPVKGKVTDRTTSDPLEGVTVIIKGTSTGTTTLEDGSYSIVAEDDAVLVFSMIGYKETEVAAAGRRVVDVSLEEDMQFIEETVVIGYGTMDKKELTSAIAHVSSEDFLRTGGSDPAMLIQGKVAGVNVVNTAAADPNNSASIQIRGISSRSAGLGPLIVIDGVAGGNLSNLNNNDIESIDILKDGAASAIYGTRGSNGVVLITTKKGPRDGQIHTSYSGIVSANFMVKELDMLTADQYREYRTSKGQSVDYGGNVDWLNEVSRIGFSHQHTLTLSGGNRGFSYRVSADYKDATGIDRRAERQEYGARAFVSHTTKSGLFTFSANIAPRIVNVVTADRNVFHYAIEANPTSPIYDPEDPSRYFSFFGQQASYNPVEAIRTVNDEMQFKFLDWNATARLNIMDGLSTEVTFADQYIDTYSSYYRPSTNTESIAKGWRGEASKGYEVDHQYSLEWLANWQKNIKGHNIKVMAGYSYLYSVKSGHSAQNKNFPNDGVLYNNLEQGEWAMEEGNVGMSSFKTDSKLIAFFGRVSYDYMGRYLFTASYRREGSSKFGANHKWGDFPAVSAGWRISGEKFMRRARWLNDLKIRADYGVTGNQDFDSYLSLNTMTAFGDYWYNGSWMTVWGPSRNVNPDLRWEKGLNWNVGLDFSMFDNRLYGSFNYFNRTQKDLLGDYNVPIPPYLFSTTFVNVGTMKNSGFEFDITWNAVRKKNFSYTVSFVGSTMDNRFVSFSNSEYVGQKFYDVAGTEDPFPFHYLQRIEEGQRLGTFYMYEFAGFNRQGEWVIYDKDGNMKVGLEATDEDKKPVGNGLPKFTASMTHTFTYRNWDLSLYFRGAFGFDIFNIHEFYYGTPNVVSNVLVSAYTENAFIKGNPIVCDWFLERGDWVKLDMASLGYTFDIGHRYIDRVRLYMTGRNLLTFTGFSGVDPSTYDTNGLQPGATGSRSYYPTARQVIFGLQIDF